MCDMDLCQVVEAAQERVGAPEAEYHHRQPRGNQPRGNQTLGVHRQRGAMVPLLPPLAALKA